MIMEYYEGKCYFTKEEMKLFTSENCGSGISPLTQQTGEPI